MAALPEHPRLWRGARALLPGRFLTLGGAAGRADLALPVATLSECLLPAPGQGEWTLLFPLLAAWEGPILLIAPPFLPYPPALAARGLDPGRLLLIEATRDRLRLWACEEALRSGCRPLVLAWIEQADFTALRRLKLAAAEGQGTALLFRPLEAALQPSPASLRLALAGGTLRLLKGGLLSPEGGG